MGPKPIYVPPAGLHTQLDGYRSVVNKRFNLDLQTYQALHEFSVQRPNDFWMSLWDFLPVKASVQPERAVDESIPIDKIPQFYEGSRLNYAENLLSRAGPDIAVKAINEVNQWKAEEVSWDDLREGTRAFATAMRATGLKKGDVVCVVGGSTIKSLCLLLAAASIGLVFSSFATDAGERVLLDRVGQLKPKVLFAESEYNYNGKRHNIADRISTVWEQVEHPEGAELVGTSKNVPNGWSSFDTFLKRDKGDKLEFAQLPFHTPFVVMFSSGTTGTPKGIVHSQGGLIVNGMKEHCLNYDHQKGAVHYHYAGIGWTLWNIMIGALFTGAQIVLYDGSPFYPTAEKCLEAVMNQGVTSFGAGPRYFSELQKAGVKAKPYVGKVDKIPSAGALLTASMAHWIVDSFGPICQISTSGGTELCGNFVHGSQTLPVYAGENAVMCLGMDVDIFDGDGKPVQKGESGELVCKKPFPNMPAMFWNDPDGKRYHAAYFDKFPHVWTHGDFIRINPDTGGLVISGRSDGVLNPSGIRFGSGEIYSILERDFRGKVVDAICVGQQREERDQAERVFLFLQLADLEGQKQGAEVKAPKKLEDAIRKQIAADLSRRHVPHFIFAVSRIPYNVNGKRLEIPLRAVISEGEAGLTKRKFTAEEKEVLELYLPFYEVEKLVEDTGNADKPKARL